MNTALPYIDCYLVPVPRANRAAYEALAQVSAAVVKEHGALRVLECWADEAGPQADSYHAEALRQDAADYGDFRRAAGAAADETVVLSFVEWPDKATRDAGMAKVTADPRMLFDDLPPVFDGRRLIAGGFLPMPLEATAVWISGSGKLRQLVQRLIPILHRAKANDAIAMQA